MPQAASPRSASIYTPHFTLLLGTPEPSLSRQSGIPTPRRSFADTTLFQIYHSSSAIPKKLSTSSRSSSLKFRYPYSIIKSHNASQHAPIPIQHLRPCRPYTNTCQPEICSVLDMLPMLRMEKPIESDCKLHAARMSTREVRSVPRKARDTKAHHRSCRGVPIARAKETTSEATKRFARNDRTEVCVF